MNKFTKYMQEYIEDFTHVGNRDCNDTQFIEEFTEWIASLTPSCFEFEGENHYCGFTVQVYKEDPAYSWDTQIITYLKSHTQEKQSIEVS